MKIPKRLQPLLEDGLIDEIICQLKSGKEAQVYTVRCGETIRCAKVYKEANKRSFKQAVQYQEGRTVRNSRRSRAMQKRTSYGQKESEEAWLSAEVDALYRLADAGVRVPQPYSFIDGVLLMELITDGEGHAAPRLSEVSFSQEQALEYHGRLITEIVRMLCAGLVHGDLSEFNVLIDPTGPVIIDLPQAVNAASNNSAQMMLARDVNNMRNYFGHFAPELLTTAYAKEIWDHYESGTLDPEIKLTGHFAESTIAADVDDILQVIDAAEEEEVYRRQREQEARDGE
ncbi:MAG: PA4780 family RIO1-like protein kinase [Pseudomonadota bacterium]|nr:PA4780 family RIO1-like protein kinase [Pseudomonadota bacterium]